MFDTTLVVSPEEVGIIGCGCGKRNSSIAARGASSASRTTRKRTALRYYVVDPEGAETSYNTLAEAQTILRNNGGPAAGWRVETRREPVE